MRAPKFVTGHVTYNLAYTHKFQLKTTYPNLAAKNCSSTSREIEFNDKN